MEDRTNSLRTNIMKKILFIALLSSTYSFSQCFVQIESGQEHTVAIADDGTLWGWGSNTSGECGISPNQHVLSPTQIGTFNDWIDVDCGSYHTIALRANGAVYTMGYNNNGQCGTGNTTNVLTPTQVASGFINVSANKRFTSYAIRADSTLWACGENNGRFGNGLTSSSDSFIEVNNGYKWTEIEGGNDHTIGIATGNNVLACGNNYYGQQGISTNMNTQQLALNFVNINTNNYNIVDADAGHFFSIIIDSIGTVYTFGVANNGQLGVQFGGLSTATWQLPFYNEGSIITRIKAGFDDAIAMNNTTIYSWGKNAFQNSSANSGYAFNPYQWNFTNPPVDASMGQLFSAFIIEDEGVYNWGINSTGSCGNGTTVHSTTPAINNATCESPCSITNVSIDNVSACDPVTNSYTVMITTTYEFPGDADEIVIGGFGMPNAVFALTGSPQTETVTIYFDDVTTSATNLSVSLTALTNINFSCIHPVVNDAWSAPLPCSSAGIDDLTTQMNIYPNPAGDELNISLSNASAIIISDINGKQLLNSDSSDKHQINVAHLQAGIYFIQTENGATTRFVKQ